MGQDGVPPIDTAPLHRLIHVVLRAGRRGAQRAAKSEGGSSPEAPPPPPLVYFPYENYDFVNALTTIRCAKDGRTWMRWVAPLLGWFEW
jgi:hypothetical protein